MNRKLLIGAAGSLLFVGAVGAAGYLYHRERQHSDSLEQQVRELNEKVKRAAIERRVSAQMEEIAYQQKEVSDEQREAANEQARIANEMKIQSDIERGRALEAQQNALVSEQLAVEASIQAERQQELAESRQEQAEHARRVADTLSYKILARSLGSLSKTQWNGGDKDLASLLAYASYYFANRYHADVYQSAIYESMMQVSNSSLRWPVGQGNVMKIELSAKEPNRMLTVSSYGEIMTHDVAGAQLHSKTLLKDRQYDFRDFYQYKADERLFVVSRSGVLLTMKNGIPTRYDIPGAKHPYRLFYWGNDQLLVVAESSLHLFDIATRKFEKAIPLNFHSYAVGRVKDGLLLFGKGNKAVKVQDGSLRLSTVQLPVNGQVWSYTYSRLTGEEAYGMTDGTIYLVDRQGKVRKLVGHRSRVSRVGYDGRLLYSTSYDGTANVWDTSQEDADPMRVLTTNHWLISIVGDPSRKSIWTGDQNGNLTRTLIDVHQMAQEIRKSLKRNMTREEWAKYVGKNIPYVEFKK